MDRHSPNMNGPIEDNRECLSPGTRIQFENGSQYEIVGSPIGYGGGSVIYPAVRLLSRGGQNFRDGIVYALKECYPVSERHLFVRTESGEIVPAAPSDTERFYFERIKSMQKRERDVTQCIYRSGSRLLPILDVADQICLTVPGHPTVEVHNTVTVMESLDAKGRSLRAFLEEYRRFTPVQTFHIIQQILFALREVHQAGYLHLDIQDGNIFIKGTLEDESDIATLIDFGCARPFRNGKTEPVSDRVIFTTQGFSAPEIILGNDGTLCLGPEADLYSVGCLLLYLLTGSKYDTHTLLNNKTGKYLTRFKLRKIDCPGHLIDRLQSIIAHALEVDPAQRYHSTDEMLEDVNEFLKALQPYRSDLSAVEYDAFICYKHGPVDSAAALALQRRLEHYHAPRGLGKERRPFRRVFIDEGELSSCADFGEQIRSALKNAGWLIVVCSPETPSSPWVKLEIDTFLEYHDRSRILAVLSEGTPETSFPEQLRGEDGNGEVFAASARGKSRREVLSKIRKDAFLRLAAPMLSTTYDSLKQRYRSYLFQRIAAATAACAIVMAAFFSYALYQSRTILVQEQRLNEAYQENLLVQAKELASQASEALEDNDLYSAIRLALSAMPSEGTNTSVVPEAEYVLTEALNLYTTQDNTAWATVTSILEDSDTVHDLYLDEEYNVLISYCTGHISIWDAETCELLDRIDGYFSSTFSSKELWPEHSFFYYRSTSNGVQICCYDIKSRKLIWNFDMENVDDIWPVETENLVFCRDSKTLCALDISTGSQLYQIDIPFDNIESFTGDVAASQDGSILAFGVRMENDIGVFDTDTWYNETNDSIVLFDLTTMTFQLFSQTYGLLKDLAFTEDNHLLFAAMHGYSISVINGERSIDQHQENLFTFAALDLNAFDLLWTVEQKTSVSVYGEILLVEYETPEGEHIVLLTSGDKCSAVSLENGEIIQSWEFESNIVSVHEEENGFHVVTEAGTWQIVSYSESSWISRSAFAGDIIDCVYGTDYTFLTCDSLGNNKIIKYEYFYSDQSWKCLLEEPGSNVTSYYVGNRVCVLYSTSDSLLYLISGEDEVIRQIDLADDEDCALRIMEVSEPYDSGSEQAVLVYCYDSYCDVHKTDEAYCIAKIDLASGETQIIYTPEEPENCSVKDRFWGGETAYMLVEQYLYRDDGSYNESEYILYSWKFGENEWVSAAVLEGSDRDLAFMDFATINEEESSALLLGEWVNPDTDECELVVYFADLVTGSIKELTFLPFKNTPEGTTFRYEKPEVTWNQAGTLWAAVFANEIYVYNEEGILQCSITTESEKDNIIDISFSPDQESLLYLSESGNSAKLVKCHLADGTVVETLALDDTVLQVSTTNELNWKYADADTLVLSSVWGLGGTIVVDISDSNWGLRTEVEDSFGYDVASERFYTTMNGNGLGYFRKYSVDELIQMGKDLIGDE
ncbi:MAG: TIR domain-containing protein [Lachnospiraceae bacterium]|nr:TIR domain-containing protein [Lachnospiraceae bacterium]